jgi:diamine N-acetyltransferase
MKLRKLAEKDAPFMLEWMKDENVKCYFRFNSDNITYESTLQYIEQSHQAINSYHFAIVDDSDEYLGTVSLKDVDIHAQCGEYAIALRTKAQGKGAGRYATEEILKFAFEQLGLNRVYLNVLSDNIHAINFYKKIGFIYEGEFYQHIKLRDELKSLMWFRMMRCEYEARKQ